MRPFKRILVALEQREEDVTSMGIILTKDNEEHNLLKCTIIEDYDNRFYSGEKIYISKYAGVRFTRGNKDYALIGSDDILMTDH